MLLLVWPGQSADVGEAGEEGRGGQGRAGEGRGDSERNAVTVHERKCGPATHGSTGR
jgi:hypothetical protein